jgi:hypothetical protein
MSNVVYRAKNDKYRLDIIQEMDPESPRKWDNLGTMVCSHRRYNLGDEQAKNIGDYDSWDEWLQYEVFDLYGGEENVLYMPLYLYDHSGITMNTTGFSCSWDSGQVGWIYVTKDKLRRETGYSNDDSFSRKAAYEMLESEVEVYDMYLRGSVYGFDLSEIHGCPCCGNVEYESIDSLWGFYGDDLKQLVEGMKDNVSEEFRYMFDELEAVY